MMSLECIRGMFRAGARLIPFVALGMAWNAPAWAANPKFDHCAVDPDALTLILPEITSDEGLIRVPVYLLRGDNYDTAAGFPAAMNFDLLYDPAVMEPAGPFQRSQRLIDWYGKTASINTQTAGEIRFVSSGSFGASIAAEISTFDNQLPELVPEAGREQENPFFLGEFLFTPVGSSGSGTALTLDDIVMVNRDAQTLNAGVCNGSFTFSPAPLDNSRFIWARSHGSDEVDRVNAMAVDADGNSYLTGKFQGTIDFSTSGPPIELTAQGFNSIFVLKMDAYGDTVWARAFGGSGSDEGSAIAVDDAGNVLIGGLFEDVVEFEPGPGGQTLTSNGFGDAFVLKLDSDGQFIWARGFGGPGYDQIFGIGTDASGDVYTSGVFTDQADFDPGSTQFRLSASGGAFDRDVFVHKLSSNGNFIWAKTVGGVNSDTAVDLAVDPDGNTFTVGFFSGTANFDPGADTLERTSAGGSDGFILKLDADGDFEWVETMSSADNVAAQAVSLDDDGNAVVTGTFTDNAFFGSDQLTPQGSTSTFVTQLSSNGAFVWAVPILATNYIEPNALTHDTLGNLYLTGRFSGDASLGNLSLSTEAFEGIWISKLDPDGAAEWARTLESDASVVGFGIGVDARHSVYTAGSFQLETDFNPGLATVPLTPAGLEDFFVLKLSDDTRPNAVAITPDPAGPTNLDTVVFTVEFDKDVFLFDDGASVNVLHDGTSHDGITVTGGPMVYSVTLDGIAGDGGVRVRVDAEGSTRDIIGNPMGNSVTSEPALIDNTPPGVLSITPAEAGPINTGTMEFSVVFDEDVLGFDASALTIVHDGTANTGVDISGSGDSYTVSLTGLSGEGVILVSIEASAIVTDLAGNPLASGAASVPVTLDTVPPVLSLNGPETLTVEAGEPFVDPGATAIDGVDGDLTGSITVSGSVNTGVLGVYELEYDVSDSAGNAAATLIRTVTVVDTTPPVITLLGDAAMTITEGEPYAEPGAVALDSFEGDLSGNIIISGTVDTQTQGQYILSYNVMDSSGNQAATVTRTVTVQAAEPPNPPVITTNGGNGPGVDFDTAMPQIMLEGTTDPTSEQLLVNGAPIPYTPGNTAWSVSIDLTDIGPEAVLEVTAVNAAGLQSSPATITIKYDPSLTDDPVLASFSGTLRDAVTMEPLSCAVVEISPGDGGFHAVAVADEVGQFFFEPLPEGLYSVRVIAPGYTTEFPEAVQLEEESPITRDYLLTPRPAANSIGGVTIDAETGLPLVGVTVELFIGTVFADETITCSGGRYELPLPTAGAKQDAIDITLVFSLENYESEIAVESLDPNEGVTVNAALFKSVPGPAAIVGKVASKQEGSTEPLADARVTITGPVNTSTTTTEDGVFAIPEILSGRYTLTASAAGHASQSISRNVGDLETREASFELDRLPSEPTDPKPGDINGDGVVNAIDVQLVINAALGVAIGEGLDADVNGDGVVNAVDVQLVINAALGHSIGG